MLGERPLPTPANLLADLRKLPAFIRRDFIIAWSYRLAFVGDAVNLIVQSITFSFVDLLVDPTKIPSYGSSPTSYMGYVAIGIALGAFLQLGLGQMMAAVRNEQLMGTLESLYMTPTSPITLQVGFVVYDLLYIPVRTFLFLTAISAVYADVTLQVQGLGEALTILMLFIPFVWGIGLVIAAAVLTFRRGAGMVGLIGVALTIGSGAYFPLHLLPKGLAASAAFNPIAVAFDSTRRVLLGGESWSQISSDLLILAPAAAISLAIGVYALNLALQRERRKGTLGMY